MTFRRGSSLASRRRSTRAAAACLILTVFWASSCTASEQTDGNATTSSAPSTQTESPTPEPSPSLPPKPKLKEVRVEGRYAIVLTLIRSNLGFQTDGRARWRFLPVCRTGACDLSLESISASYTERVPYMNGKYRFSHRVPKAYTCGTGDNIDYYVTAVRNVTFAVSQMRLIDGEWIATKLTGSEEERGTKGCGLEGIGTSKFSIRAKRVV